MSRKWRQISAVSFVTKPWRSFPSIACITIGARVLVKWYSTGKTTRYFRGFVIAVHPGHVLVSPTGSHKTLSTVREVPRGQPYDLVLDEPPEASRVRFGARVIVRSKEITSPTSGTITNEYHGWYEIKMEDGEKVYERVTNIRLMETPSYCEEVWDIGPYTCVFFSLLSKHGYPRLVQRCWQVDHYDNCMPDSPLLGRQCGEELLTLQSSHYKDWT